ncbi:hypothetical protein TNCV_4008301 [Trichonephila clavipes]|nr:hypothetical protein TNCV_4008301 [Trichonephila clavipes]
MIKFIDFCEVWFLPARISSHSSHHCWRSPLPHASALIQRDFGCVLGVQQTKQLPHEPLFSAGLPKNTTIVTSLLEARTKSEPTSIIKAKWLKTIAKYPQDNFAFAYTDGSSEETFLNGGLRVFKTTLNDENYQ